ncbi:MAG: protein-glutamate O-methyltransferase CheR [Proteobacteria bacterium]|nr:protein-glutamate O-methyltransferase CheR [Pseudomonadota bacterium]
MNGFQLTDKDFHHLSAFVHKECGINLHEGKRELVRARLSKRIRFLGLNGFGDYYDFLVKDPSGDERVEMLNAISTNLTSFFREPKHFKFLTDIVFPDFQKKKDRKLMIWSAGCSTGEEAYSVAICSLEFFGINPDTTISILATDISTRVLEAAGSGIYPDSGVSQIPSSIKTKYFQKGHKKWSGHIRVKKILRRLVEFSYLNLMDELPYKNCFDIIFCRNVMIYFQKSMQEKLVQKYFYALKKGGYLFIGHSETLMGKEHNFKYIMPTIYQKV